MTKSDPHVIVTLSGKVIRIQAKQVRAVGPEAILGRNLLMSDRELTHRRAGAAGSKTFRNSES